MTPKLLNLQLIVILSERLPYLLNETLVKMKLFLSSKVSRGSSLKTRKDGSWKFVSQDPRLQYKLTTLALVTEAQFSFKKLLMKAKRLAVSVSHRFRNMNLLS